MAISTPPSTGHGEMIMKNEVENMVFEEAFQELEAIVSKLESGDLTLEESIEMYEMAASLRDRCREILDQAERRVEMLVVDEGKVEIRSLE